jgi:4-alpha-glucanotransferase
MPGIEAPLSEAAAACVHSYVVGSNAVLALVQADDLTGETVAVNIPGTGKERPNWRKLREPMQTIRAWIDPSDPRRGPAQPRNAAPTGQGKASG